MQEIPLNPMFTWVHLEWDKWFSFAEMRLYYLLYNEHSCWCREVLESSHREMFQLWNPKHEDGAEHESM